MMQKPNRPSAPDSRRVTAAPRERAIQILTSHLAGHGLRMTSQRETVLDYMLDSEAHGSMEEISADLRKRGVGRATVFRTVKLLEECHLISRVSGADGTSRYETTFERPHHDHLICIDCGGFQEVSWPEVERIQSRTCREMRFQPLWHRHEIFGRCERCSSGSRSKKH